MKKISLLSFVILILFTGCTLKEKMTTQNSIMDASSKTATELSTLEDFNFLKGLFGDSFNAFNKIRKPHNTKTIIVTTFVSVDNLDQTSNFGRLFSDTMITELKRNNWKVIDLRGKQIYGINNQGIFFLDKNFLSTYPKNSYILVGTYAQYKKGLITNMRLLDIDSKEVISASNVFIDDLSSVNLAKNDKCKNISCKKELKESSEFIMTIIKDDCDDASKCED